MNSRQEYYTQYSLALVTVRSGVTATIVLRTTFQTHRLSLLNNASENLLANPVIKPEIPRLF